MEAVVEWNGVERETQTRLFNFLTATVDDNYYVGFRARMLKADMSFVYFQICNLSCLLTCLKRSI